MQAGQSHGDRWEATAGFSTNRVASRPGLVVVLLGIVAVAVVALLPSSVPVASQPSSAQVESLLNQRARGVLDGTVVPGQGDDVGRLPGVLARVPFVTFRYRQVGPVRGPLPPSTLAQGGAAVDVDVRLQYRLPGDTADVVRAQRVSLRRPDGGGPWRVAGVATLGEQDLWDHGPVIVARGRRSTVIAAAGPAGSAPAAGRAATSLASATELAAAADAAAARVDAGWRARWRDPVVLLPGSTSQWRALVAATVPRGSTAGADRLAAVTVGRLERPGPGLPPQGSADRVVVNPDLFFRLTATGRRVVLAHEFTHVAVRAVSSAVPALWLQEGLADYVGYRGSGLADTVVVADVLSEVRAGRPPAGLPPDEAFTGDAAAAAYAGAAGAAVLIARDHGEDRLLELYRTVAGIGRPAEPLDTALRQVLGISTHQLQRRWQQFLQQASRPAPPGSTTAAPRPPPASTGCRRPAC